MRIRLSHLVMVCLWLAAGCASQGGTSEDGPQDGEQTELQLPHDESAAVAVIADPLPQGIAEDRPGILQDATPQSRPFSSSPPAVTQSAPATGITLKPPLSSSHAVLPQASEVPRAGAPELQAGDTKELAAGSMERENGSGAAGEGDDIAPSRSPGESTAPAIPLKTGLAGGKTAATLALTTTLPASSSAPKSAPLPDELPSECELIRQFGERIALARAAGKSRKDATNTATAAVLAGDENASSQRSAFSGRVYGTLIYRLDPKYDPRDYAAYAQAACFVLRGTRRIIPASPEAEQALNRLVTDCSSELDDDRHAACIAHGLNVVVERYR